MNKKIVFIIALAIVLALLVSLVMSNNEPKKPRLLKEPEQQEIIEEINIKIDEPANIQEENITTEDKTVKTAPAKTQKPVCGKKKTPVVKSSEEKKVSTPVIKVEHVKEAIDAEVQQTEENIKEVSSNVEETSNEIVITTEYKFKSPAKYSFK